MYRSLNNKDLDQCSVKNSVESFCIFHHFGFTDHMKLKFWLSSTAERFFSTKKKHFHLQPFQNKSPPLVFQCTETLQLGFCCKIFADTLHFITHLKHNAFIRWLEARLQITSNCLWDDVFVVLLWRDDEKWLKRFFLGCFETCCYSEGVEKLIPQEMITQKPW